MYFDCLKIVVIILMLMQKKISFGVLISGYIYIYIYLENQLAGVI